jgi:putative addiction module component (TIGR02574 family)
MALSLNQLERAELVGRLLSSLEQSDQGNTELWVKEAESRLDAYEAGKIKAVSLKKALSKYK